MEEKIKQSNPTLHKYLFTVTTFSKILALSLFIILPFVGFYLGIKYQELKTPIISSIKQEAIPQRPATPRSNFSIKNLGNANIYFENKDNHLSFEYPDNLDISTRIPSDLIPDGLTEMVELSKISTNGMQHYYLNDGLIIDIATAKKDPKINFMEYVKKSVYVAPEVKYFKPIDYGKLKGYEGGITNINGTMRVIYLEIPETSDYYFYALVQAEGPNKVGYDSLANKIISTLNYIK